MIFRYADSPQMYWLRVALGEQALANIAKPRVMYTALELYYLNNGLYDGIQQSLYENAIWTEGMKGLRNPAHRVVEFYAAKLAPGKLPAALPIIAPNKSIIPPIEQVWKWSNFTAKKQLAARQFSNFGDLFIKTATKTDPTSGEVTRVYFQLIKPHYVTSYETDERGFLTEIRLDIPVSTNEDGIAVNYYDTEFWSKDFAVFRRFRNDQNPETPVDRLELIEETSLEEFGIDFVPFVHGKFKDIGDGRGLGSFTHTLDKIDEANRMATRLHQILFRYNKPILALAANSNDASGRPIAPPRIGSVNGDSHSSTETIELRDDVLFRLPGTTTLETMVPQLQYSAALEILNAHLSELERDLPELAYYRLREMGNDISGRAVRLLLSDAVDRAIEARGNFEDAIARANQMALTIGIESGLFPPSLGSFDAGDFEHEFAEREIIQSSEFERAETITVLVTAGFALKTAARKAGWSEDDIDLAEQEKDEEREKNQETLAAAMLNAQRTFNSEDPESSGRRPPAGPQNNEDAE